MHQPSTILIDILMIVAGLSGLVLQRAVGALAELGSTLPRVEPVTRLPTFCVPLRWSEEELCDADLRRLGKVALLFVTSGAAVTADQVVATVNGILLTRAKNVVLVVDDSAEDELLVKARTLAENRSVVVVSDRRGELTSALRVQRVPSIFLFDRRGQLLGRSYTNVV